MPRGPVGVLVKVIIGLAVIATANWLYFGYSYSQPHFRITLELETSEGRKTASSVVKVRSYRWWGIPLHGGNQINTSYDVTGYAPMIDIDPHGWVLVQVDSFLGNAIVGAYKRSLYEIAHERPQGAKSIDASLRLIGPDGNWHTVKTSDGDLVGEILTHRTDGWKTLRQNSRSTVSVVEIRSEITNDPVVERLPNAPEWLLDLRRQAKDHPQRKQAAVRLQNFETGAP